MSTLYESILSLCTERGIKGGRMCNDLGLSKSLMTDLKAGRKKSINAETAQKIADYFGVTTDRVLGKEKAPTPEDERIGETEIMAAFFRGADPTLTEDEMGALWDDARSYMEYKLAQRAKKGKNEESN